MKDFCFTGLLVGLLIVFPQAHCFVSNPRPQSGSLRNMVRNEGETNDEYMRRMQEAASDPIKWEKFVMNQKNDEEEKPKPKKKGVYQRIEEWDAQRTKDDMSWEERVQYDGQRFGNGFEQNEILRKNLKSW